MPSPTLNLNLPVGGLAPGLESRFLPKSPLALPAPDGTSARASGASAASCLAAFQFAAFLKAAPCRLLELAAIFDANRAQLHLAPAQTRFARRQTCFARRQTRFARRQTRFARRQTRFARRQTCFARRQTCFARGQTCFARGQTRFTRRQTCFARGQTRFARGQTRFARRQTCFTRRQTRLKRGPARAGEWTPRAWSARGQPLPFRTRSVRFAALRLCDFATLRQIPP